MERLFRGPGRSRCVARRVHLQCQPIQVKSFLTVEIAGLRGAPFLEYPPSPFLFFRIAHERIVIITGASGYEFLRIPAP